MHPWEDLASRACVICFCMCGLNSCYVFISDNPVRENEGFCLKTQQIVLTWETADESNENEPSKDVSQPKLKAERCQNTHLSWGRKQGHISLVSKASCLMYRLSFWPCHLLFVLSVFNVPWFWILALFPSPGLFLVFCSKISFWFF